MGIIEDVPIPSIANPKIEGTIELKNIRIIKLKIVKKNYIISNL